MAPHITAELWERRHGDGATVHAQSWPAADPELVEVGPVTMVVQVNGKVRERVTSTPRSVRTKRWPRRWLPRRSSRTGRRAAGAR